MAVRQEVKKKELPPLPTVEEAGKLLLPLFEREFGSFTSPITQHLLKKNIFYSKSLGYHDSGRNTAESTPDSPQILRENVDGADQIITITIDHHWLAWGPQEDLVFAYYPDESIRAFRYPKGNREGRRGLFREVGSLEEVRGLVGIRPKRPESNGARMILWREGGWEKKLDESYYLKVADLTTHQISVIGILKFIKKSPQP